MVQITNHFERAIALLASQFREQKANGDLTNFHKMIRALVEEAQEIEDVKWQLKTERWLETAIGEQLDLLGELLGLPRNDGESDDDYRERLRFQVFINISNGTPEDAIAALAFFTQGDEIGYHELHPAAFQMETNGLKFPTLPTPPNVLNDSMFGITPVGVNYVPIVATYNVPIPFEVSGDLSSDPLFLAPDVSDPSSLVNLQVDPYSKIIYVSIGNVEESGPNGGLDELDFPLETAGQLSELIQKNGNFPAPRFE